DWRVRAAAIAGCRTVRSRDCLGWLVEQLGREEGRLRWDVVLALTDLADRDLGLSPDPWRAWWAANRETFTPRPAGTPGSGPPSAVSTQASFFSVPILSTRMVFLLDLSGSMREPAPGGGTKLEEAKRGMLATIRSLPPKARFGITGLGCDATGAWTKREEKTWGRRLALVPASPSAKADAERFVQGLEAHGWTNLWDGLEHAMSAPDVDTVFLYSDGGASKGTFSAAGEILSRLERLNRFRRVVVHAVEVPGERNPADNRRLLGAIARATGGDARLFDRK
ncbi:MAG TPA: hypothetical protein VEJ18_05465, partial [Planctomycetota bacterium]|nr:hypothetical protein [Planctomycetota bacterium]